MFRTYFTCFMLFGLLQQLTAQSVPVKMGDYYVTIQLDSLENCAATNLPADSIEQMHLFISLELSRYQNSRRFGVNFEQIHHLSKKYNSWLGQGAYEFLLAMQAKDTNLEEAYTHTLNALEVFETHQDTFGILMVHFFSYFMNRGSFNTIPGDKSFKLKHFDAVTAFSNALNTPQARIYQLQLNILEDTSKTYNNAEQFYNEALTIANSNKRLRYRLCGLHTIMSTFYAHRNEIEKAKKINQAAYALVKSGCCFNKVVVTFNLGYNHFALGELSLAEKHLAEALNTYLKDDIDKPELLSNIYGYLSETQFKLGKYVAWKNQLTQDSIRQVFSQKVKTKEFVELETRYATKQKESEIKTLEEYQKQQTFRLWAISIFTIFLFGSLCALWLTYRRVRHLNQVVVAQNSNLASSNKRLEHFTYALSHDALGYIADILNYANFGKEIASSGSDFEKVVQRVHRTTSRLKKMAENLISYNRMQRNNQTVHFELSEVLAEVVEDMNSELVGSDISLKIDDLTSVCADREFVKQVFRNLMGNAVKFRRTDVPLVIEIAAQASSSQPDFIEVQIKDNGMGIEAEKLPVIFKEFVKGNRAAEGSGLGLYICRQIIENFGGRIWATSEEGKDSVFGFTLPTYSTRIPTPLKEKEA